MDSIQIKDKQFTVSIKEQDIQKEVIRVANEINRDLADKNPLFLSVLNGSFMFTADLLKHITIPCEISFVKLASYQGVTSTGVIKEVIGLNEDIAGRTVVIVEDIVDTGLTMQRLLETLGTRNPCLLYTSCPRCHTLTTEPVCDFCSDATRDNTRLCVVESVADQKALEASLSYRGGYFVLMGRINPLEGTEPERLGVSMLLQRIHQDQVSELILATSYTPEGDVTAHMICLLYTSQLDVLVF